MKSRERYGTGQPPQQPASEEVGHPPRGVEHRECVPRGRSVDDDEVESPGGVQVVELLHRQVVVAVDEAAGDVLVQRVGEHGGLDARVRGVAPDQLVPPRLGVEHRRPQLASRLDTGLPRAAGSIWHRRGCRTASSPSAVARRRAGSTVRTSTRPADGAARPCPSAAAVVVLPTPPEPRRAPSRAGEQAARSLIRASHRVPRARHRLGFADLVGRWSATSSTTRRPPDAGEQLRHVITSTRRDGLAQPGEVVGRRCADASVSPAARRTSTTASPATYTRIGITSSRSVGDHLLPAAEEYRAAPGWRTTAGESDRVGAAAARAARSISVTGISSGVVTTTTPGDRRVVEEVEHPLRLVADEPDLDEIADHPRRTDLADDVTARLGVDDDEVVVLLADLVAELADGQDLLDPGRRVGDEVERRRQRADPAEQGDPYEQPQVLAQRVLGVHRHREQTRLDLDRLETPGRPVSNAAPSDALGVHLAHQHPLARGRAAIDGERGSHGRLADATLPGDEQQPTIEQVAGGATTCDQPPKPMRRSPSAEPRST